MDSFIFIEASGTSAAQSRGNNVFGFEDLPNNVVEDETPASSEGLTYASCAGAIVVAAKDDPDLGLMTESLDLIVGDAPGAPEIGFTMFLTDGTPVRATASAQTQVPKDAFHVDFAWDGTPAATSFEDMLFM